MSKLKWMNKLKKELKKSGYDLAFKFNWLDWEEYYKDGYSVKEAIYEDMSYTDL